MDLAEFAAANPVTFCWVCSIAERGQIEAASRAGITRSIMRRWLIEDVGYAPEVATIRRLEGHLKNHVRP